MRKPFLFAALALLCALASAPLAGADVAADLPLSMKEEIKRLGTTPAVIVNSPDRKENDGYFLHTLSEEQIAKLGLIDPTKLENDHVRVVEGETEEVLPFTDFDGRNVLFHLMEAHSFYQGLAEKTGVRAPRIDHKITVRVRMAHEPNASGTGAKFTKVAHSNDAGYMPFVGGQEEIWFYARKRKLRNFSLYSFLTSEALALLSRAYLQAGLTAASELYRDYDAGIDTAKIPNVIWHEAFHWVSDDPSMIPIFWQGVPPAEDFANYFAASLYGKPYLADLDEFTGRFYRRNYGKVREIKDYRASQYNSKSFVPSLLWELRGKLGAERTDQIVWSALPLLRASVSEVDVQKALTAALTGSSLLSLEEKARSIALIEKNEKSFRILDIIFGNKPLPEEPARPVTDPAELADNSLTDEEVIAAGVDQIEALRELPEELQAEGVEMTDEEKAQLRKMIDELKAQTKKPRFRGKVAGVLKKIAKPFVKAGSIVGQGVGIAAETFQAVLSSPLVFGTDFFTGLILGKARITDAKPTFRPTVAEDIVGAGGGALTYYYANRGINLAGGAYKGYASEGVMGAVLVDQLICSRPSAQIIFPADRENPTKVQAYCQRISRIAGAIRRAVAKAGAVSGKALRK